MKNQVIRTSEENIVQQIYFIRGEKVMLDFDLATLYGVETKQLKQAVKRNIESFPNDFMFELTSTELENLRSHFVTSSWGGTRYMPMAFTEQGVAMLSSVLKSKRAREVNIAIMRIFVRMRKMLDKHKELSAQLKELENRLDNHDATIKKIFEAIRQLMQPAILPRNKIGFKREDDK